MTDRRLSPQDVIQSIRSEYGISAEGLQKEEFKPVTRKLRAAVEHLSEGLYSEDVHFILELIQNAEDNQYEDSVKPDLSFILLDDDPTNTLDSDGCLCVFNN